MLTGTSVHDPAFEDWLRQVRLDFHDQMIDVLQRLASLETGEASIAIARRAIELDPINERSHRILMRCLADNNKRALAVKHFVGLEALLQRELGTAPAPETVALRKKLDGSRPSHRESSPQHLLVLPCVSALSDPVLKNQCDHVTEEIIGRLKRYRSLNIVDGRSSLAVVGAPPDATTLAGELGISHVADFRIRRSNSGTVLCARLEK